MKPRKQEAARLEADYLERVRAALAGHDPSEVEEVIESVSEHIEEELSEDGKSEEVGLVAMENVLERLGPPAAYQLPEESDATPTPVSGLPCMSANPVPDLVAKSVGGDAFGVSKAKAAVVLEVLAIPVLVTGALSPYETLGVVSGIVFFLMMAFGAILSHKALKEMPPEGHPRRNYRMAIVARAVPLLAVTGLILCYFLATFFQAPLSERQAKGTVKGRLLNVQEAEVWVSLEYDFYRDEMGHVSPRLISTSVNPDSHGYFSFDHILPGHFEVVVVPMPSDMEGISGSASLDGLRHLRIPGTLRRGQTTDLGDITCPAPAHVPPEGDVVPGSSNSIFQSGTVPAAGDD